MVIKDFNISLNDILQFILFNYQYYLKIRD